jgi:hypothetical protein
MLQLAGCSPQAFSYLRCSLHICIQVFSYVADHLLYQTIHVVADDPAFGKHLRSRSSHSSHSVSFTVIAIVLRTISSPCHYRYPPRSTEHIPLVPHPVVLQTMSIYHCRYSPFVAATVISVSQVILSLSSCRCRCRCRPLHPHHKSQHLSLAGARPLERAYCHELRYVSFIQLKFVVRRLDP